MDTSYRVTRKLPFCRNSTGFYEHGVTNKVLLFADLSERQSYVKWLFQGTTGEKRSPILSLESYFA
jgi:hypothetical protein